MGKVVTTPQEIVKLYFDRNYKPVFWPQIGDSKGPKTEKWQLQQYAIEDYSEKHRVGLLTGTEVSPGRYLHDVDIDWALGADIALRLLPETKFVFGRASKQVSHCFYYASEPIEFFKYLDIGKEREGSTFLELRGTKTDGTIGLQTMVPPSIWSKDTFIEPLQFLHFEEPTFVEARILKQAVCLSAIGMILAKHLGVNSFGHEAQLAWAGFLLRAGIDREDLIKMGEAMCGYTNHTNPRDIRMVVESTAARMTDSKHKIKGGPSLAKLIGSDGLAVVARINEWLERDSDFIRNKDGVIIKDSQENIKRAFSLMNLELSFNVFSDKQFVAIDGVQTVLTSPMVNNYWLRIDREYHFRPSYQFFEKVADDLCFSNPFHPVKQYLDSLVWDGVPRVEEWLIRYGSAVDSEYVRAVSRIVLLAAVCRIYHPGCKYDEMLILESEQGKKKSSALRGLCYSWDWFSDDLPLNVDAKELIERTLGKWIIEASDLSGHRKTERDQLKSMLSRQVDGPARMAYKHIPEERPRHFIIIGSTNDKTYLADSTGARRFWPVVVGNFDDEGLIAVRDQLWAEAKMRLEAGESIRLPEGLWSAAGVEQELRREEDAWEEGIGEMVDELLKPASDGRVQVTTARVWEILGIELKMRDRVGAMRISEIMQRKGFTRTKIRDNGKVQAGYVKEGFGLKFDKKGETLP